VIVGKTAPKKPPLPASGRQRILCRTRPSRKIRELIPSAVGGHLGKNDRQFQQGFFADSALPALTLTREFGSPRKGSEESLLNQLDSHMPEIGWTKMPEKINFSDVIITWTAAAQKW
jgi:hypothetical protein|tara:strand:- start:315 stop:665 length:351 start_codon:yes stop_codon:yes gene_type:complete